MPAEFTPEQVIQTLSLAAAHGLTGYQDSSAPGGYTFTGNIANGVAGVPGSLQGPGARDSMFGPMASNPALMQAYLDNLAENPTALAIAHALTNALTLNASPEAPTPTPDPVEILIDDITAGSTPMGPPGGVTAAPATPSEAALSELGINTAAPAPAAPDVAASSSDASASDGEGDAGDSMQRGGIVKAPKDARRRTTVHGGEFVVNRRATDAHRQQLEAWNRQGRRRSLAA